MHTWLYVVLIRRNVFVPQRWWSGPRPADAADLSVCTGQSGSSALDSLCSWVHLLSDSRTHLTSMKYGGHTSLTNRLNDSYLHISSTQTAFRLNYVVNILNDHRLWSILVCSVMIPWLKHPKDKYLDIVIKSHLIKLSIWDDLNQHLAVNWWIYQNHWSPEDVI